MKTYSNMFEFSDQAERLSLLRIVTPCMTQSKTPYKIPLIKFCEGKHVFDRIHLDFSVPIKCKQFLLITDAYSKWPDIYEMERMDTTTTLNTLRDCVARCGLPNCIITDNGPQFVNEQFKEFCQNNCIKHTTSPPYIVKSLK